MKKEFILWGYKPRYASFPIKLEIGTEKQCQKEKVTREKEGGWLLAIFTRSLYIPSTAFYREYLAAKKAEAESKA